MNIYEGDRLPLQLNNTVVSVGTFDGVHLGHQVLIGRMREVASQYRAQTLVITFNPPPKMVLGLQSGLKLLTPENEKIDLLRKAGIDNLWVIPFTREFAQISHETFIEEYLAGRAGVRHLVMGHDHSLGKGKQAGFGDILKLAHRLGFSLEQIPALVSNQSAISSSFIRQALNEGKLETANNLLGYNYALRGAVVRGNQIGKLIGFPTANLRPESTDKLIPAYGVYACLIDWKKETFKGMSNIGTRPTLETQQLTIEANIFDFNEEIYHDEINIRLVHRVRDERKFGSLDMLKRQLMIDKEVITAYFNG